MVFQGNNLQVRKTNIKCHDEKAGFKTISSNKLANTYIWIIVERSDYQFDTKRKQALFIGKGFL